MSWARYCYFWLDATHGRFKIRFLPSGEMSGGKLGSLYSICLQQRGAVTDSPYHKGLVGISDQTDSNDYDSDARTDRFIKLPRV